MKYLKQLLLVLLVLSFSGLKGQFRTEFDNLNFQVLELDYTKNSKSEHPKTLPYDYPIHFKIKIDSLEELNELVIFIPNKESIVTNFASVELKRKGKGNFEGYLKKGLLPNEKYHFAFLKSLNVTHKAEIYHILELLRSNETEKAEKRLNSFRANLQEGLDNFEQDRFGRFFNINGQELIENYSRFISPIYDNVEMYDFNPSNHELSLSKEDLIQITKKLKVQDLEFKKFEVLFSYLFVHDHSWTEILSGRYYINSSSTISIGNLPSRIANLDSLNNSLNGLIQTLTHSLLIKNDDRITILISELLQLKKQTQLNIGYLNSQETRVFQLVKEEYQYAMWDSFSTIILSREKSTSHLLSPDFGLAYLRPYRVNDFFIRPYYGFNINFRQLNGDQPRNSVPQESRKFSHHFAVNVGLTIGEINQGKIEDLLNKSSLITGLKWKTWDELGFSAGLAHMRIKNPNPTILSPLYKVGVYFNASISTYALSRLGNILNFLN